jgi:hypothetical protein
LVDIAATAGLQEIALLEESGALVLWRRPANKVELLWDVPADAPQLTARRLIFEAATKSFVVELSIDEESDDSDEPASAKKAKPATVELKPQRVEAGGFTIDVRIEKPGAEADPGDLKCDPRKALTAEQRRQLFKDYARRPRRRRRHRAGHDR